MTSLSLCKRPLSLTSLTAITLSVLGGCSAQQDITNSDEPSKTTVHSPVVEVVEAAPIVVVASDATYERMAAPTHIRSAYPISSTQSSEKYAEIKHNAVNATHEQAFATLSIDTDTGSYANVRRFLNNGRLPPTDAVRVEELINYFNYDFKNAKKQGNAPFLVSTEVVKSPWHATNRIVKVGIKAEDVLTAKQNQPAANLVFLVDVSGSMNSSDKLPLAKSSLKILTKQLRAQDTITLITYAGNTEVVLPATPGNQTQKILNAIDNLSAHGSTNGEAAIKLAYQQAEANFKKNGINRILMLTDGDFNVGVSNVKDMLQIIRSNRDKGISLSTLGFGQGNYNDHMME